LFQCEHICLQWRYSVTAAYICLLKICCLAAILFRCLFRGLHATIAFIKIKNKRNL
jgi:hypothetical protein